MYQEPISTTKRMRQDFRVAIRRQKKEQIFRMLRSKQKEEFLEQEKGKMLNYLDTPEKREDWLHKKALDLTGMPDSSWRFTINELFASVLCFKGKGCFQIWIQTSIIQNLCVLFKEDYLSLGLGPSVASLLGNVICLEEENEEDKISYISEEILKQQNVIQDIINMADDHRLPHGDISHLMTLIYNLACNDLGYIVKWGGLKVCIDWSLRMLREKKINRAYLDQIYYFFERMSLNIAKIPNNYNFSNQVFMLYTEFIQIDQSSEMFYKLLITLNCIIASNKQAIYSDFLGHRRLVKKVFQLSVHEQQSIRELCWHIFAYVSSSSNKIKDFFMKNNVFDMMILAYQKEPVVNGRYDNITIHMVNCLSNMAAESDEAKQSILCSGVIDIIFDSTHEERPTNLKKNAYYCLCNLITTQNYNLIRRMIFGIPVFEKLTLGLDQMCMRDSETIKEILSSIYGAIEIDRRVFRCNDQGVLEILESKYSFHNILETVQNKHSKNVSISRLCNNIFDMYSW